MTGHQIRHAFLEFFASRNHRIVRSSSLVPHNDPTLLFTNAGMNQFKDVFLGQETRDYSRATSSQKCVRAGGKHNDLENVGVTRRHHTFFEMLGNFSFGDYFKADAIAYGWELVTKDYGLPKDRLYVTVFREDDEAEELWQKIAGVSKDRIFRLDEKDNFWQMGDTGPCGPCSEIHFDLGPEAAEPGREHEQFPLDGGGRFVEIWNLVFMQYDRDANGTLSPLPKPSIDTGMGLERVAAILQGKLSNFDTDLILPIIEQASDIFKTPYGADSRTDLALRINADHSRATTFLIHDGVVPSNEGRGYVLRKIMRRALRNARMSGVQEPYLSHLTGFVADLMKPAYPELQESVARVARIVKEEEHRYAHTYQVAERVFHDEAKSAVGGVLPGTAAFRLYDTFGLAMDEQQEMAQEFGLHIDTEGFASEMSRQRERARASWKGGDKTSVAPIYAELKGQHPTTFLGYDTLAANGCQVVALLVEQKPVQSVGPDTQAELVLDQTPFYAEAGGQVGDQGSIYHADTGELLARVEACAAPVKGLNVHKIVLLGPLHVGDRVDVQVDGELRRATMRNHTATHLLHAALRTVLGTHVKQAGSVVDPGRLRFDFAHFTALDEEELRQVERLVNEQILANTALNTRVLALEEALTTGAMALFGEKYGDRVRVVEISGFSTELCGGTHVPRTGDIGVCKVVYEGSISAGVRRIEAVTGEAALRRFQDATQSLGRVSQLVHTTEAELLPQVEKVVAQQRQLERQVEQLKQRVAQAQIGSLESSATVVNGVKVLTARVDGMDRQQMRTLADTLRNKWQSAVLVLASTEDDSVTLLTAVTKDLTSKVHAGKLVGSIAQALGGRGGGRPDLAEAGAKDVAKLSAALEQAASEIRALL